MTICFVANFYKTELFDQIGKNLTKRGVKACWIVTKADQFDYLVNQYGAEQVLKIDRTYIHNTGDFMGDFKINELVYGDRVFKHEIKNGLLFLRNIQKPIYDFILKNRIQFVIGEITWAHELLTHRIVNQRKELNCKYIEPSVLRLPNNRFAFFTNETQYNLLEFNEKQNNEIIKVEPPKYLKLNDNILKKNKSALAKFLRAKRFFSGENIERNDPNVITNRLIRFKVNAKEELNKITYGFINKTNYEAFENEKFIFIGLHKQPEASIDVSGRYHDDQCQNIINLWRLLPNDWKLVVKEHTNAIGDRPYSFYKKIISYPSIILANENINSKMIISKSKLVVSVTGTICYEAALLKIPSITFSNVFFNRINYSRTLSISDLAKYKSLIDLVEEIKNESDNRLEYSNYIMKNSFDGYITDPNTDISVLEEDNITKVSDAFYKLKMYVP